MNNPLISICVPIYGVERYIERCARSLFEQTYENIEYVFVNDCTKDRSMDILYNVIEEYPNRKENVKIVKHNRNRGLAAARNTGLDNATGKYIFHVDSDDWVESRMVEDCVLKSETDGADIVVFGMRHEYQNKKIDDIISAYSAISLPRNEYVSLIILQKVSNTVCGKMYLTDLFRKNSIRSIEEVNYAEDYAIYPILAFCANKIAGINTVYYHYDRTNDSSYTHIFILSQLQNQMSAYNNFATFFRTRNLFPDELQLSKMQIYAWARRKGVLSGIKQGVIAKETGVVKLCFHLLKSLSLNHRIIITLDALGLYSITDFFIKLSEVFGASFRNKK